MSNWSNQTKNSSGAFFDIATFDNATFNTWINLTKNSSIITNLSKASGSAFFDIAQFDVATFNPWTNLAKS